MIGSFHRSFQLPHPAAARPVLKQSLRFDGPREIVFAIRWFDDGRVVFACGLVNVKKIDDGDRQVEVVLPLLLKEDLPGGAINRRMAIETIITTIVRSFGARISMTDHGETRWIYKGPVQAGIGIRIDEGTSFTGNFSVFGSLDISYCKFGFVVFHEPYLQWARLISTYLCPFGEPFNYPQVFA
jgi:hypothetical protein